ncbi:MAG TPA: hypothetical protein VE974_15535 [Thermoanaerobaculia bacterium]|nr:hypothetical protein [Thermoanaerobaculia bacterium]
MADPKPTCGPQTATQDTNLTTLVAIISTLGAVGSGIAGLIGQAADVGAIGGALAIVVTAALYFHDRCLPKKGPGECTAGVVNEIHHSFSSAAEWIFPFTSMHDRVEVVVKSTYWRLVAQNAGFVKCALDSRRSPILQNVVHSDEVCNTQRGALVGSGVGAVAGLFAAAAAVAAIGCAGIITCLLALILAAIIAAVAALIGAFAGGMIGKATTSTAPAGSVRALPVGNYVTTRGILVAYGDLDGAVVSWDASIMMHGGPSRHGEGPGGGPPYSHPDPDANLGWDGCTVFLPPGIVATTSVAASSSSEGTI